MSQEATIRRGVRNARYAAIPNHVFEDMRLSMEARWLLGYLLSKPDNWTVVQKDIANKGGCGRDKARKMIAELVDAGYAEKEQARDSGRFGGMSLVIYDEPLNSTPVLRPDAGSVAFLPQTEIPSTVNPSTETPSTVNQALVITNNLENTENRFERGVRESDQEESQKSLERSFWRIVRDWPKIAGLPKDKWFAAWCALTPQERLDAAEKRDAWIALLKANGKDHIHVPETYFREKLWKDVPDSALKSATGEAIRKFEPKFGPVWGAKRMLPLFDAPRKDLPDGRNDFLRRLLREDSPMGEVERRKRRIEHGYPEVNKLDGGGVSNTGTAEDERFREFAREWMVAVVVNSDVWNEWQSYFDGREWPWVPDTGRQPVVYFPKGGPSELSNFETAVQGLRNDDGR